MPPAWPRLPFEEWRATCDTIHLHAQVLGKIAQVLAPQEPDFQHVALRLSGRGWETRPLSSPNGSGAVTLALDLRAHEVVIDASGSETRRVPLTPSRSVGAVTIDVLAAVRALAGDVQIKLTPSEVPSTIPLDEDEEHATYETEWIVRYLDAVLRAELVLAELRAAHAGPKTPVNAWWGSFDVAVTLAGEERSVSLGWWPGDDHYPHAAFYAYATPVLEGGAGWDEELGEFVLPWDDVLEADDPHATARAFLANVSQRAFGQAGA
jgi:hypothetical protein